MKRLNLATYLSLMLMLLGTNAYALMITETVGGRDNLYFTEWGHFYTLPDDNALNNPDSNPASVVSFNGSAFDFSGAAGINITATGFVVDDGPNATDANGNFNEFMDGNFRQLPAYSLIGIFSTTADVITPLVDPFMHEFGNPQTGPFFIGTQLFLDLAGISNVTNLYLFLAENDGVFKDNFGYYDVNLKVVPLPASALLFMSGLLAMFSTRIRRNVKQA